MDVLLHQVSWKRQKDVCLSSNRLLQWRGTCWLWPLPCKLFKSGEETLVWADCLPFEPCCQWKPAPTVSSSLPLLWRLFVLLIQMLAAVITGSLWGNQPTLARGFTGCWLHAGSPNEWLVITKGWLGSNKAVKREIGALWSQSEPAQLSVCLIFLFFPSSADRCGISTDAVPGSCWSYRRSINSTSDLATRCCALTQPDVRISP